MRLGPLFILAGLLAVAPAMAECPPPPGIPPGGDGSYPHCQLSEVASTPRWCLCPYPPPAHNQPCLIPPP